MANRMALKLLTLLERGVAVTGTCRVCGFWVARVPGILFTPLEARNAARDAVHAHLRAEHAEAVGEGAPRVSRTRGWPPWRCSAAPGGGHGFPRGPDRLTPALRLTRQDRLCGAIVLGRVYSHRVNVDRRRAARGA
jgi:hypothetical protein